MENRILIQSIKDFFTFKMLKFAIMPFVITLILMYIIFFIIAGLGVDSLSTLNVESSHTTINNGIPHTEILRTKIEGLEIIQYLMSFAMTSWIATFLIYAIGGFLTLYISIFITVIIIGFLTPAIMRELQVRNYPEIEMIGHSNILFGILNILKWSIVMLLLFVMLIPFYFIPILNIIAFNFPLYYFFHKMLKFDISSNICTLEEDKHISYFSKNTIRLKTLALYLISLIPFAIFFSAVFYVVYLGNTYFDEVKKIRN